MSNKFKKNAPPGLTHIESSAGSPQSTTPIPGEDFDPENSIGGTVSKGWGFIKFSLPGCSAVVALVLYFANSKIDPVGISSYSRTTLTWLFIAVGASLLNSLSWATGPQADLKDLRLWIRTENELFPLNNFEERAIWLQIGLVSISALTPLLGPTVFGLTGVLIYLFNFLGFVKIKSKVDRGVSESKQIYSRDSNLPAEVKHKFLSALQIIDEYWGTSRTRNMPLIKREAQQIRHLFFIACFIGVVALGAWGRWGSGSSFLLTAAYALGSGALVLALVSITVLRTIRQNKLHAILTALPREYRAHLRARQSSSPQSPTLSILL